MGGQQPVPRHCLSYYLRRWQQLHLKLHPPLPHPLQPRSQEATEGATDTWQRSPLGWPSKCWFRDFFKKIYGGCGASGRRGDRPRYCTVLGTSWERVRYASAPGCPGRRRASCALTDLHTNSRPRRSAGTHNCTLLYNYDAPSTQSRRRTNKYLSEPAAPARSTLAVP